MSSLERETRAALQAVRVAAELCERVRAEQVTPETLEKKDRSPVTVADFGSQAVACRVLEEELPGDRVVAEEDSRSLARPENAAALRKVVEVVGRSVRSAGDREVRAWIDRGAGTPAARFWTLDPIDGTLGFLRGDQYAIALALIVDGRVVLGALACPALGPDPGSPASRETGCVFLAVRGEGCRSFPLKEGEGSTVRVSETDDSSEASFVESVESGHSNLKRQAAIAASLGIARESRRLDSQAKYGVLARGEASIYLRLPTPENPGYREKIWDHAAGSIVIEEAGGRVTDSLGHPLDFSRGKLLESNTGVVATNGKLHEAVIRAVGASREP